MLEQSHTGGIVLRLRRCLSSVRARTVGVNCAVLSLAIIHAPGAALALDAPGAPGIASVWAPAAKDFLGTSISSRSQVYFTGAEGILTEVFYPTLDRVQNVDLQILVTDLAKTWGDEERRQRRHEVSLVNPRAMIWRALTTADSSKWRITKKIFTDPQRSSVIQRVTFETLEPGKRVGDYNVYVLNNPAINNSGGGGEHQQGPDNSRTLTANGRTMLVASEPNSTSSAAGFIPEQVWNATATITGWETVTPSPITAGTATRSMQPLSWAMGEYINLIAAMAKGASDAPAVVCQRYACDQTQSTVTFRVNATTQWGESIDLIGNHALLSHWVAESGIKLSAKTYPVWSVTLSLPAGSTFEYKFIKRDGAGKLVWESGENRAFSTPADGGVTLDDRFREPLN